MASTNEKDRTAWVGIACDPTPDFIARQSDMIETYRQRLILDRSPFGTDPEHWWHTSRYALEVFAECLFSLQLGRLPAIGGAGLDLRRNYSTPRERDQAALHCIHAARTLFGVISEVLCEVFPAPRDSRRLAQVLTDLHTVLHRSLEKPAIELLSTLHNQRELSREVHDRIGNHTSLALRQLELLEVLLRRGAGEQGLEHEERIGHLKRTLVETMNSTRDLVDGLRSESDAPHELEAALLGYLAAADVSHPVVHVHVDDDVDCVIAAMDMGDALFLMVRECLRNTLAHADASVATVDVGIEGRNVVARIQDNGVGFEPHLRSGNGLGSLYERAGLLDGSVRLISSPGSGTQITITVPFLGGSHGEPGV
ncbi:MULTISPECIES: sensor histidine kinase [Streptomyces]|uniref:sensor histidine kinase n=1 Tax=Streptomyces TaxID=1883 RepID=UPI000F70C838|nr:ATP-binding protein [Streptomyces sp. W1SF4]AZM90827.1 hypothetical protein D1J60_22175 [Streptomyces sp. W1SF4]